MAKKKTNGPLTSPNLLFPRDEAARRIKAQVEKGNEIRNLTIISEEDLRESRGKRSKWSDYNIELLGRLFDNRYFAEKYEFSGGPIRMIPMNPSRYEKIENFKKDMYEKINILESILERLELIPEVGAKISTMDESNANLLLARNIFIVHGQDEAAKQSVARFLEKLELNPIILHEKPDKGRTLIEKFEDYSGVCFAIILLTPDDIGYPKDKPEYAKSRARQNVIFELGYFIGKLGRENVCALYKEGVELPSDIQGVLYVPMDPGEGWHMKLAREIKHSGINVDLNKVI